MKILLILNDPPYGTEDCYTLRLALALQKKDPATQLSVFLMADAVAAARAGQKTPEGYYNLERMLKRVLAGKGQLLLCGTCMDGRRLEDRQLMEGSRRSTMDELAAETLVGVTALGEAPIGRTTRRGGARPDDVVFVTGTIGNAALGLSVLQGALPALESSSSDFLRNRYRLPQPRVALGPELVGLATASIDVSDGLVADLRHLCGSLRPGGDRRSRIHAALACCPSCNRAGCGDGALACVLASRGAVVIGIDADPTMLAAARVHAETAGARATFVQSRIERLPFPDATFDTVVAITILCFIADASEAVSEMRRVLRPTGHLVLGELGLWSLWALTRRFRGWLGAQTWNAAHFRSAGQLRSLVENAGLAVTTIRGAAFYPPIGICARALAPLDPWLGRLTTFCAAFIALSAAPIGKSTPRRGCSAKLPWPQTYT